MNENVADDVKAGSFWSRLGRAWYRPPMFAGLLAVAVIAANYRVVFFGETFGLRDFAVFGYPLAAHLQESLRAGELPLWNVLSECGHPFLGQWNTMVLYPFMLLTVLFPLGSALAVFCLVHQYVGGLGMYFLARRWSRCGPAGALAGILYSFDGIMQTALMWPNNIAALGLLPWVVLAVQSAWRQGGRVVCGAALLSAIQLLSGAPEMILVTWLFVLLALGHDWAKCADKREGLRLGRRCGCVVVLAALLAAAQLIPFFDLLIHSERAEVGGRTTSYILWYGWANFFLPLFENIGREPYGGTMHASQIWTHSYFLGYVPWLLLGPALFRNNDQFPRNLAACAVFALIFALGPDGRLYRWLDAVFPLELMRYPVKFLVFWKVGMPLLAAWGLRRLSQPESKRVLWWTTGIVGGLFGLAVWLQFSLRLPREGLAFARADVPVRCVWFGLMTLALWLVMRFRMPKRRLAWLFLSILVWANLLFHQPQLSPSVHPGVYSLDQKAAAPLKSAKHPHGRALPGMEAVGAQVYGPLYSLPRIIPEMRTWLAHNANLMERVPLVGGFYALHLPRFRRLYHEMFAEYQHLNQGLADFMGVTHTTKGTRRFKWVSRTNAQPIVTVGRQPVFVDGGAVVDRIAEGRFDPASEVFFDKAVADLLRCDAVPSASASLLQHDPHRIEIAVSTSKPAVLTVAQIHYHWWRAEVDGQPVPIHFANHAFQGMMIPAGEHRVVMRYVDQGFRFGAVISFATLLGIGIGWWRLKTTATNLPGWSNGDAGISSAP